MKRLKNKNIDQRKKIKGVVKIVENTLGSVLNRTASELSIMLGIGALKPVSKKKSLLEDIREQTMDPYE